MKLTIDAVYSTWNRLFRNGDSRLLRLPEDILVDEVFSWLSVRDIVRLRQVCKPLSALTKKPAIWKRFLPFITQIQQPLAPLPPTRMYNLLNLTGHEMETIVSRAISYDMAWKRQKIEYRETSGAFAYRHVEEMVILPGGHFLIMSARSFDGMYGLLIWSLEHRATQAPAPLLFRHTEVKAYGLTAKYMKVGGLRGITVAFLRKRHKENGDTRHIPETFEMGGKEDEEDSYMPLKYECTALHVSLQVIDYINDRKSEPMTHEYEHRLKQIAKASVLAETDLWQSVARIRTGTQLGIVSLDVIEGIPHVCVVKRPNMIIFQPLGPDERSVLECVPNADYGLSHHSIWNFRVLPEQNQVLVVRNIDMNPEIGMKSDHLTIEIFGLPEEGQTLKAEATSYTRLTLRSYLNVQISEVQRTVPSDEDDSITPYLKRGRHPQPLSLFLRTEKGMAHHSLWPVEKRPADIPTERNVAQQSTRYFVYELSRSRHIFFGDQVEDTMNEDMDYSDEDIDDRDEENNDPPQRRKDDVLRFLPGARRALVYAIPRRYRSTEPPITACWGFQYNRKDYTSFLDDPDGDEELEDFAEMEAPALPQLSAVAEDADAPYHPSLDIPHTSMERTTILGPMKLPTALQARLSLGTSAVCFDEDTGRVVFATKRDNRIHVVDCACTRPRDDDDVLFNEAMDEALQYVPQTLEIY